MLTVNLHTDHVFSGYVCVPYCQTYKNLSTFCTKISDSIKNYVHCDEKQPRQEVGGGYIVIKTL